MPDGIVGRRAELAAVDGVLARAASGPAGLHLVGEPGVGKTTLLREAAAMARERGFTTLVAAGASDDEDAPYRALSDLLSAAPDVELPGVQRLALSLLLLDADEPAGPLDPRAVTAATATVLAACAPVALAVDDLQWVDAESRGVLARVLGRLDGIAVAVVTAARPGSSDAPLPVGLLSGRDGVTELTVAGLDTAATATLVERCVGTRVSLPTAETLHATTLGNPLLTLEIARLMASGETGLLGGAALPVPERLGRALRRRVDALPGGCRDAVEVVAVAHDADEELVAAVLQEPDAANAVAAARDQGVLVVEGGRLRVFHPLAREVVLASMDDARRRRLHARLADLVADPYERARHLVGATREADDRVADAVADAAEAAAGRGAPGAAAQLFEQAAALSERPAVAALRLARAGELWLGAGDAGRAVAVLRAAAGTAPPDVVSTVRCTLGRVLAHRDGTTAAIGELRTALDEATTPLQRATACRDLAALVRFAEGNVVALAYAREALAIAADEGDEDLELSCIATVSLLTLQAEGRTTPDLLARGIELERRRGLRTGYESPRTCELFQLFWTVRLDEARDAAEAILAERAHATDAIYPLYLLGLTEWRAGRWDRAAEVVDSLLELVEQCGWTDPGSFAWLRALVHAARGDHAAARAWADRAAGAAAASGESLWADHADGVRGHLLLVEGDAEAAADYLARGAGDLETAIVPGTRLWLPDLVEALVVAGRAAEAEAVMAPYASAVDERGGAAPRAVVARCRALVAAAGGDVAGAIEMLEPYASDASESPERFQLARNDLVLGTLLRRARRRRDAAEVLARAARSFEELGAPAWLAKAEAETARLGRPAAHPVELTPTEAAVGRLVAAGRNNRDVARELSLSVKTVEWNLTRVYRKLGVTSRAALAAGAETLLKSGDSPGPAPGSDG